MTCISRKGLITRKASPITAARSDIEHHVKPILGILRASMVTHVTDLQACWERIREVAGLEDVRIHDLRHSFASIGAATGDSMLIIGALLGHSSPKTTARYTHLSDHPLKMAADRISGEIALLLDPKEGATSVAVVQLPEPIQGFATDPVLGKIIQTKWLDTRAAAARLGFTVGTMQTYRWMGTGPDFRKIGRRVVYGADALDAWARQTPKQLAA